MILPLILCALNVQANTYLLNHVEDLASIQSKVTPGDTVVFANKIWSNYPIELKFNGTAELPVVVMAQTRGQVIFSGSSSLKISGTYTYVEGFVFKNISSKTIIFEFRTDKNNLAKNCRVSNCVIDNCNPPNRL